MRSTIAAGLVTAKDSIGCSAVSSRRPDNGFATSLNKQRDPASDAGKFMSDAATAFAVLALTQTKSQRGASRLSTSESGICPLLNVVE